MYTFNDLHYFFYLVEFIARRIKQPNLYVASALGEFGFTNTLEFADILHCSNTIGVAEDYIRDYKLDFGTFDITENKFDLPTPITMGGVYARLFLDTSSKLPIDVYSLPVCKVLDDYNTGAYYEPRECIANNFTTPFDRFYGRGQYCTPYKPQAVKWSKLYGGTVYEFNLSIGDLELCKLDNIVIDYHPDPIEDILVAPMPDGQIIDYLYNDNLEILREFERCTQLLDVIVLRNNILPESKYSWAQMYTTV